MTPREERLAQALHDFREHIAAVLCETRGHTGRRPCDFCLNVSCFVDEEALRESASPAMGEWLSEVLQDLRDLRQTIEFSRDGFTDGRPYVLTYSDIIKRIQEVEAKLMAPPAAPSTGVSPLRCAVCLRPTDDCICVAAPASEPRTWNPPVPLTITAVEDPLHRTMCTSDAVRLAPQPVAAGPSPIEHQWGCPMWSDPSNSVCDCGVGTPQGLGPAGIAVPSRQPAKDGIGVAGHSELARILGEVCAILRCKLGPGLARYAPLIQAAREATHAKDDAELALLEARRDEAKWWITNAVLCLPEAQCELCNRKRAHLAELDRAIAALEKK